MSALATAEAAVAADPYSDAWSTVLQETRTAGPPDAHRDALERFLRVFPTSPKHWRAYAEFEIAQRAWDRVGAVFRRCLLQIPSVDLWRTYLAFIVQVNASSATGFEEISKAYEFALQHIGQDVAAGPVWSDFLAHVKALPAGNAREESQRMLLLRRLYQRALSAPVAGLEALWREYEAWETALSPQLARAVLAEQAPRYHSARAVHRSRKALTDGLQRTMLAKPPTAAGASDKAGHQVQLWKKLLAFERGNPQKLERGAFAAAVTLAYNQCLLCLYHYPEIWWQAARFLEEQGLVDEAVAFYSRSAVAVPECMLLRFAHAELFERIGKTSDARQVYEALIERKPSALAFVQFMRFARRAEGVEEARKVFLRARRSPACSYHVYVASALMEFHQNKDSNVARKIFEHGLNAYASEPGFVRSYLEFLGHLNEDSNLRALFERALPNMTPGAAREIWELFLAFERNYGSLESVASVERRFAEAFPDEDRSGVETVLERFRFLDLQPCNDAELESFGLSSTKHDAIGRDGHTLAGGGGASRNQQLVRPNYSQWAPFVPGSEPVVPQQQPSPPLPPPAATTQRTEIDPVLANFLAILPPVHTHMGPFVDVDLLMASFANMPAFASPQPTNKRAMEADTMPPPTSATGRPQEHDLFRERQAAKAAKLT